MTKEVSGAEYTTERDLDAPPLIESQSQSPNGICAQSLGELLPTLSQGSASNTVDDNLSP